MAYYNLPRLRGGRSGVTAAYRWCEGKTVGIDIGSRLELFVDDYLIDRLEGAELRMHQPTPQGVALRFDSPWEGNSCNYVTVFQDGDIYRMYYRALDIDFSKKDYKNHPEVICYAESRDGVHWDKPSLGLVEYEGSSDNNIILDGPRTESFTPFRDDNPACEPDAVYKAVGVGGRALFAYKSADGIHWSLMRDEPIITDGVFDSQNLIFWDTTRGEYREYHRDFRDGRDIKTATSQDFTSWPDPVWVGYSPGRVSELYTNGIQPYYRAPHIFVGFPTRYVDRGWTESTKALPQLEYRRTRSTWIDRAGSAITDGMFMTSRDGLNFNMWPESFIRPGLKLRDNWFYGDNYQGLGILETDSPIEGADREMSVYSNEAAEQQDSVERLRRYTLRVDGFVSVNARLSGGELLTKPLVFGGSELVLNFSTGAAGGIRVEVQDNRGIMIDGYSMDDCDEIWGDDLRRVVTWKKSADLSAMAGQPIRLRFRLKDADLYSIQFRRAG